MNGAMGLQELSMKDFIDNRSHYLEYTGARQLFVPYFQRRTKTLSVCFAGTLTLITRIIIIFCRPFHINIPQSVETKNPALVLGNGN